MNWKLSISGFAFLWLWAGGSASLIAIAEENDDLKAKETAQVESLIIEAGDGPQQGFLMQGNESLRQLLVTGRLASGRDVDLTREVAYVIEPAGVAHVDAHGLVTPRGNGTGVITARLANGLSASLPLTVQSYESNPPVNFPNQVVPILTKYGCNGGGCHGAARGQNGFMLSLLGFEPSEDLEYLVKSSRGRRLSLTAPDQSLLLKKATGQTPHGGGARMEQDSPEYRLLRRWIAEGARAGNADAGHLTGIEVFPSDRVMSPRSEQQLLVIATYSDGTKEDVTATAVYEANVPEMATVSTRGLVTTTDEPGDVGIMVRYQSNVAVFRATIPLGKPVDTLPPTRNFIDEVVFRKLKLLGLPPSAVCDDSTFLRRVTLDLAGRLPTENEAAAFLANQDPGKRDQLIDKLLDSTDYANYFTNKWSTLLRNQREVSRPDESKRGTYLFHNWIRQTLLENRPYDQFVREILTASGEASENPPVLWYRAEKDVHSQVEDVTQLFLGQRLQCARCHHHPFERWSQADYYKLTAFFSRVGRKPGSAPTDDRIFHRSGAAVAAHPRTGETLVPAGLGAAPISITPEMDPRVSLVDWMTAPENPFFAKSLVNRYWKHFFGRGLVDPEDDMRATNPAVNPELLAALEQHFVDSKYDLKGLIRTICQSSTYQLSSEPNAYNEDDRQNFSRFYPRRLNAEVLLDAVDRLTGSTTRFTGMPVDARAVDLPDSKFPSYFLTVFGRPQGESVCECERVVDSNLAQSLHLINSPELTGKITDGAGNALRLANARETPLPEKIRELYLIAYSREPQADEIAAITEYLKQKSLPDGSENKQAYEDLVWSLMNTKEFLFNH
ncbi:DUF1549 and DUF1553 domain-containing protein [Planctomicrobium sp. SH661]|uniref:DUF1549 and DUF1553 domain-containing protein n=1 Tax=Planctomicrobium sp. SH661 TaxID=3448124 RepID=UPI003F5C02AF